MRLNRHKCLEKNAICFYILPVYNLFLSGTSRGSLFFYYMFFVLQLFFVRKTICELVKSLQNNSR